MGDKTYYYDVLSMYGFSEERAKEVEAKWGEWIRKALEAS
jgi:hypothetical protein